jgi:pyridoxine 5-phosphate synthase
MIKLGVNIDHVATLREARKIDYPDPVHAAALAELGGADSIVVHLREDRRHVKERDLKILRETVKTRLNMEMALSAEIINIALEVKPDQVTIVPEKREELTTEGGLDVAMMKEQVAKNIALLKDGGIEVSLFINPDLGQVSASHKVGAQIVEIHTGAYCEAKKPKSKESEREKIIDAAKLAKKLGMQVAAGHGLHYNNIVPLLDIKEIEEYNIGHSIVARAVLVGMERAVKDMLEALGRR